MKVDVKNLAGSVVDSLVLSGSVFDVAYNHVLVSEYIRYCLLTQRSYTANTKNRSDVAGSGKKRRRQKKTGRARMGEIAPHHRGGPVARGPRIISKYELEAKKASLSKHMTKKQRRAVLAMALSEKLRNSQFIVVDKLEMNEIKSKAFNSIRSVLNLQERVLFVDSFNNISKLYNEDKTDSFCKFFLSCRNFFDVNLESVFTMTVHNILKFEKIVMTVEAVSELMSRYGGTNE